MTDANGHITNFAYDPLNRPISIIDPLGHTTSNTYDAIGNRISLTDAAGSLTTYSYDPLNQLVEVTDAMGGTVHYSYDAVANMISMTDANGHTTNYAYDSLNRPTSMIDPLGYTTSNIYDAVGNVVSLTDANGNSTSYNYDALNRLAKIAYDDGQTVNYGYDATGNRLMMADGHGTINYQYDNLNRLVGVTNPDSQTVGYMYDVVGNRIQITYPDGKTMTYGYDANNRLTGVTDWNSHITGYSYDANSNLIGMTYPNGMNTEYLYDENNQLIELINENATQVVSSFEYTLDAVGNRQSVAEWFSGRFEDELGIPQVLTTSYEYDDIYRLTQVNYPFEETVSYNYDPMGNRISMTTTIDEIDKTINYVYDASDRLLQSDGTTYDYDNNGNMVRKTENPGRITSYNYDGANRLISLSTIFDGSQRERYNFEYDGDGNRLSKTTINGKRTQSSEYLLDVNTILPQVLTESDDKDTTFYAHGLDLISMTDPRGKEFYYHYDGLGSVRSMSDSKESIKTIYSYDAFGQTRKEMGHVDNDFRFTGEQMDGETGLIYLRARYYDPDIGRFISKDPFTGFVSDAQSLNRYSYVRNNPVRFVDPQGLSPISAESKFYIMDLSIKTGVKLSNKIIYQSAKLRQHERSLRPFYESRKNVRIVGKAAEKAFFYLDVFLASTEEAKQRGVTFQKLKELDLYSTLEYAAYNPNDANWANLHGFSSGLAIINNVVLSPAIAVDEILFEGESGMETSGEEIERGEGLNWLLQPPPWSR